MVSHLAGLSYRSPNVVGNSVILTIIERFSKLTNFALLSMLSSAKETTKLVIQHAFHLHGLQLDVVSN